MLVHASIILLMLGFDYFLFISDTQSLSDLLVIYTEFSFLFCGGMCFLIELSKKISRSREIKLWSIASLSGIVMYNLRYPEASCREPVIINRRTASQCVHCHISDVKRKLVCYKMFLLVSPRCHATHCST